jgi:hypothetical protein
LYTPRLESTARKGILPAVLAAEDSVFSETEMRMHRWQSRFRPDEMEIFQKMTVNRLLRTLERIIKRNR